MTINRTGLPTLLLYAGIFLGGGLIAIGMFYPVIRAYPPSRAKFMDKLGNLVSIEALDNLDTVVTKIGIVGNSTTGKTTLANVILRNVEPSEDTREIAVGLSLVHASKNQPVGVIDGAGGRDHQQYNIAVHSDILVVMLDHSSELNSKVIEEDRLKDHRRMSDQVIALLQDNRSRLDAIIILVNKKDLWGENSPEENSPLQDCVTHIEDAYKRSGLSATVLKLEHSNRQVPSCNTVIKTISKNIK